MVFRSKQLGPGVPLGRWVPSGVWGAASTPFIHRPNFILEVEEVFGTAQP